MSGQVSSMAARIRSALCGPESRYSTMPDQKVPAVKLFAKEVMPEARSL